MTLFFLAAWLAARLVTSCLEKARAPKQEQTGKKGRAFEWERGQCVRATDGEQRA